MEISSDEDDYVFQVGCLCTDPDHSHLISVEADPEFEEVTIYIYTHQTTTMNKWKAMWNILWNKDVECRSDILMNGDTAMNYGNLLIEAVTEISRRKKVKKS